jgi:hypothetical protein
MPHIAFELDAIAKVSKVARSAGVQEGVVAWGLVQLWEWCWREKRDTVSAVHLKGFFGCDLVEPLEAFNFLEKVTSGLRVRGAQKYLRIRQGNSAGGHAAKGNLVPGGGRKPSGEPTPSREGAEGEPRGSREGAETPPRLDLGSTANSEQRTANSLTYVREAPPPLEAAPPAPPEAPPPPQPLAGMPVKQPLGPVERPTTPPEAWEGLDFWRWTQDRRQASGYLPERPPHPRKVSSWWSEARTVVPEVKRLKAAYYAFGEDPFWRAQAPPFPFAGFMSQWERFVPPVEEDAHAT